MNGLTVKGSPYNTLACGLASEVIRNFGEVRLRVFGTSMVPSILPGDLISIERASLSEISPGEIVLFSQQGRLFAHRVVAGADSSSDEPSLVTRGDRLGHNDPPVSSSELLGRVISIERGDGRGDGRGGKQMQPAACLSGWERMMVRFLRHSGHATYLYVRLAALWGRFVGRTFRSDNRVGHGEGLLSAEASGAKARNALAINVGAKASTHKPNESHEPNETFAVELRAQDTEGVVECRV